MAPIQNKPHSCCFCGDILFRLLVLYHENPCDRCGENQAHQYEYLPQLAPPRHLKIPFDSKLPFVTPIRRNFLKSCHFLPISAACC